MDHVAGLGERSGPAIEPPDSPTQGVTSDTELIGAGVVLVPVTADHVPGLRQMLARPEVWLRWGDEAASPQWPFDDPSATRFAVMLEGDLVGMVQYFEEDEPAYRHASIDVFVDPAVHGRGVGRDAVGTLARHLINDRGHHRLIIDPAADNEPAIRCYTAVGFRPVGVMRRYERDADRAGWHDGLLMDLLAGQQATTEATPGSQPEAYTHGHHESVLRTHRWRTAENSAGYLLADLEPGQRVLDVGCGPGTITIDLARLVAPGTVVGIDVAPVVVEQAEDARLAAGAQNVRFAVGDGYALDHQDDSFDVVHAHQVLQHLSDPVAALVEWRRVLRPGGILAVRDSDYGAFVWAPADRGLDRWLELHHQVTARNNAHADAGRLLLAWVGAAGFSQATATSSTWTFADPAARQWWAGVWAERVERSAFADQAIGYQLSDAEELAAIAQSWRSWAAHPDAMFIVVHGEVLARG